MLKNKIIFMTGATSGLGRVSALKAAKNGAKLIVLARNKEKGQGLCDEFESKYSSSLGEIEVFHGDLSSFDSIASACELIKVKYPVIDMIVNNAGIMNFEHMLSVDEIEETLQVNLLTPILICDLLFENIKKSGNPKVIFTSSGLHQGKINFQNIEFDDSFSGFKAYRQSKLGVILLSKLLASKFKEVKFYTQHPGVVRTDLGRSAGWFSRFIFYVMGRSPDKGSETLSFLIETSTEKLKSGEYYSNKKITSTTKESCDLDIAERLFKRVSVYLKNHVSSDASLFSQ